MFEKYLDKIKVLENFQKEDILNENFQLYSDPEGKIKIYYAPHNEIINKKAKVFIVGITPGWTQTCIAYKTANEGLIKGINKEQIQKNCKINSRFAGSMRKNIIEMLDELDLNNHLNLNSCAELFEDFNDLLHTTSLIPYPVFINGKNYTGSNPKMLESEILSSYIKKYFYNEVNELKDVMVIPLGIAVEEVLNNMVNEGIISAKQCLFGFPHPSGANGHRKKQFESNKKELKEKINLYFKSKKE